MKDKIINIILTLITLILIGIVATFGFVIYNEIVGNGKIQVKIGDKGYPEIEFTQIKEESASGTLDESLFEGVDGEVTTGEEKSDKFKHLYNQLNDNSKMIYNKMYQNKENLKTGTYTIEFGNTFQQLLLQEDGDKQLQQDYQSAIEALIYDNPDIFYIDVTKMYINIEKIKKLTGIKYNVYINQGKTANYLSEEFTSKEEIDNCELQIEQVANQILASANGKSDYEKIRIVHDYLVDNVQYESGLTYPNLYDIYGTLVNKKCVCEGYAKSFQYLMNKMEIDNCIVIGTGTNSSGDTENHAWNYVQLDGKWYGVDVTWDDPIIIGGGKASSRTKYKYFLKGSRTMSENHVESGNFTEDGKTFEYPTLSIDDYKY